MSRWKMTRNMTEKRCQILRAAQAGKSAPCSVERMALPPERRPPHSPVVGPGDPPPARWRYPDAPDWARVFWFDAPIGWSSAFRLFRAADMLKHELQRLAFAKEKTLPTGPVPD